MRVHLLRIAVLAGATVCLACSGGGPVAAQGDAGTSGGLAPPPASEDPVLRGRWERVFSGLDNDAPNADPWVDARDGAAHFVYRSKTGQTRYFVFDGDAGGQRTEIAFPQGTKSVGRVVVLPGGDSVVFGLEQVSTKVSSFRRAAGSPAATPGPPLDPTRGRIPFTFESAELEGDAVFAGVVTGQAADGGPLVAVDRLGTAGFATLGEFAVSDTVARLRLASDGRTLALAVYAGTAARTVRTYGGGAWRDLGGLPSPAGAVGLPSLVVDGGRVFLLEYDEASSTAGVWLHDGTSWAPFVRSQSGEGLRSLVLHGGALYAIYGDVPNKGLPVTRGVARLDRDAITRVPFDGQSADGNIDPDSRHDVSSQEDCRLVSRGTALFLTYAEGSTATQTLRLYRHVPR